MRRSPGVVAAAVALGLALAACTGGDPSPRPVGTPTPTADPGPQPEDVVATVTIPEDGQDVEVDVHPFVRTGDLVVLTLDLTAPGVTGGDVDVPIGGFNAVTRVTTTYDPMNLRAYDLRNDVAHHVATDADERPVTSHGTQTRITSADGLRMQVAYAAPPDDVDRLALFVPGAPLVAGVPVVDGDVPVALTPAQQQARDASTASPADELPVLDLDAVVDARTFPLESTSRELDGAVQTVESTERLEVTLGADVLFAFDSADLDPAAREAVALVAQRVAEREPGTVDVVGHTDDQGDDAYNEDLSRRRAQAVADALAGALDAGSHPTAVAGRGESEPVVPNDSDENRALNRRVTVTLTSTVVTRTDVTVSGELPPFERGLVGVGGEPVRVESGGLLFDVTVGARRVDGHVVVDLVAANADGEPGGNPMAFLRGFSGPRGEGTTTPLNSTAIATVLAGSTRLYVLDYMTAARDPWPGGEWFPTSDLESGGRIGPGQARTYSYVFPRLTSDTVTLQIGSGRRDYDLRVTDVPVAPEAQPSAQATTG